MLLLSYDAGGSVILRRRVCNENHTFPFKSLTCRQFNLDKEKGVVDNHSFSYSNGYAFLSHTLSNQMTTLPWVWLSR